MTPNNLPAHIGKTIHRLRHERDWTLQQLADLAHLSKAHVWELEQGAARNPTIKSIISLAQAFGVPVSLFLGSTDVADVPKHHAQAVSAVNALWKQAYQAGFKDGRKAK